MEEIERLRQHLHEYIEKHSLTQTAVSNMTGVPQPTLSDFLAGKKSDIRAKNFLSLHNLIRPIQAKAPALIKLEAAHARRVRELERKIKNREDLIRELLQGIEELSCALSFPGQYDHAHLKDAIFQADTLVARSRGVLG
jgi:predicted XRE-type DNA-binding protein